MNFIIRECKIADGPYIQQLNRRQMGYDFPLRETMKKLEKRLADPSQKIFVAEADEQVVGYIHLEGYDTLYAPHMKNILGIATARQYQRRGIGRALLSAAENWARHTGAAGVRLVSGEGRKDAHKFYAVCGYDGGKKQINFKKIF